MTQKSQVRPGSGRRTLAYAELTEGAEKSSGTADGSLRSRQIREVHSMPRNWDESRCIGTSLNGKEEDTKGSREGRGSDSLGDKGGNRSHKAAGWKRPPWDPGDLSYSFPNTWISIREKLRNDFISPPLPLEGGAG